MKRLASLSLLVLLAACSTASPPVASNAPAAPTPPPAAASQPAPSTAAKPVPVAQQETPEQIFARMRATLDKDSVYFDFDKYAVRSDQYDTISEHAKLANAYRNDRITLQGNCDERGGREYNLALGQRRAETVKQRLTLMGVAQGRIEAVSFGKEKPRALCHEEKCWTENRRTDFVDHWQ